jgi:hypothetical protein
MKRASPAFGLMFSATLCAGLAQAADLPDLTVAVAGNPIRWT